MESKLLAPLDRQRTISEEIAERIVLAIASGEQLPGKRLTESHVASVMNVSRVPAREALQMLASKGVLVPLNPRGLKVMDFTPSDVANLREVRIGLEAIGVKRAMERVAQEPPALAPLKGVLAEMKGLAKSENVLDLAQCDVNFHRNIMRLSGNDLLLNIWEDLSSLMMILFCRDWHANRDRVAEYRLHQSLFDLIESGDDSRITDVLEAHFPKA